jgi:hypothetical protein
MCLRGRGSRHWRRCQRTVGHHPRPVLGDRRPPPQLCLPVLREWDHPRPGTGPHHRRRHADRGYACPRLVSKYADYLPLYRQARIYSRQGIDLDRSTLAAWVGTSAFELTPVYDALLAELKRSTKLFMDETPAPVLAPGRKKTKNRLLLGFGPR